MIDIEKISEKIMEEKNNLIAKAFTCQISNLLLKNGIVPIMKEYSFEDLKNITDSDRYKLVYKLGVSFDSLDTSKHDKKIYNQALEDFEKCLIQQSVYIETEKGWYGTVINTEDVKKIKDKLIK